MSVMMPLIGFEPVVSSEGYCHNQRETHTS